MKPGQREEKEPAIRTSPRGPEEANGGRKEDREGGDGR